MNQKNDLRDQNDKAKSEISRLKAEIDRLHDESREAVKEK